MNFVIIIIIDYPVSVLLIDQKIIIIIVDTKDLSEKHFFQHITEPLSKTIHKRWMQKEAEKKYCE